VYNCIYDDETVISLEQGPCQDTLSNGAQLVDANYSETDITVTTEPPSNLPFFLAIGILALYFGWGG
jgi:hypothetical protein